MNTIPVIDSFYIYKMKRGIPILLLLLTTLSLQAQQLLGLYTDYSDTFREWTLVAGYYDEEADEDAEIEGSLDISWTLSNDFSDWTYELGDHRGTISQKFSANPGLWELRSEEETILIQQTWRGDPSEWKINGETISFTFLTEVQNDLRAWAMKTTEFGELFVYSEYSDDPRSWIIEDFTREDITFSMRMAAVFIAVYNSVPKE